MTTIMASLQVMRCMARKVRLMWLCATRPGPSLTWHSTTAFFTPFWRNTLLGGFGAYSLYAYFPAPSPETEQESTITRYLAQLAVPIDRWTRINETHVLYSAYTAEGKIVSGAAERPVMRRFRFPA